ncbi:MAG: sensor histidine kinase, partial [Planctomycetota bacterium]|jgi:two-component system phosphate regulon sensor histidine kinase PhoR
VIATGRNNRILLINQAARRLLGDPVGPIIDRPLQSVLRNVNAMAVCDEARCHGRPVGRQVLIEPDGVRRTLDVRVSPIEGGDHYLGQLVVLQDVTDRARVEAMKAEFVANTSHELRTPLATVRATADSLADAEDWPGARKLIDVLDRHVTRLEDITADLLSLHSVEHPHQALRERRIDLASLGEWIEHQYARHAEAKSLTLAVDVRPPDASVCCDPTLVEMILQNLIDNAVKFTQAEGQIRCRLELAEGRLTLAVADTGCGIVSEDQPRVFERFFQADRSKTGPASVRGSGLGLSIVKHAAQRLGADVQLESEPQRGTTVTVRIPQPPDDSAG